MIEDVVYPPTLLSYLRKNGGLFRKGVLFAILRFTALAPIPWLFQLMIDEHVATGNTTGILVVLLLVCGLLMMHYSFSVQGAAYIARESALLLIRLRGDIFNKLHFLNFGYLDRQKTGRLLSKYAFDTQKIEQITVQIMNQFMPNILYSFSITVILLLLHWQLAAVLVLFLPLFIFTRHVFHKRLVRVNKVTRLAQEKLTGAANEAISAIRLVRSYGEEEQVTDNLDQHSLTLAQNRFQLSNLNSMYSTFTHIIGQFFTLITIAGGAYFVIRGSMTMGTLLAFMAALPIVLMPLHLFTAVAEQFFVAQEGYRSIKELLDSQYVEAWRGRKQLHPFTGRIRFDGITFAYPNTTQSVLTDFSLTIEPGTHVALVGASGSGKSTVAQLILGLYKPDQGHVFIDEIPQEELDMRWLRRHAAVVLQDIVLFSGSIADNIRFAYPEASDEEMKVAAQMANADTFIQTLADGYDTTVGERGVMLSGGQRQRLSIARAILRNPRILILDEATSALDYESERLVQEALNRVAEGRTVITIAHRLSTIRHADRIIVLQQGRIIDSGHYDELADREGPFKELLKMQEKTTPRG